MLKSMSPGKHKQKYKINLVRQHQLCERNYLCLLQLLPHLQEQDLTRITVDFGVNQQADIVFEVKQRATYTTHIRIHMEADWGEWLILPDLEVRLYHDVQMAEIIFSKRSQQLEPLYTYPNPEMYQPNEKEQWNEFLAELLNYCLKGGMISEIIPLNFKL